eukprot:jgi/Ulvmu1/1668/UM114_0041.1
MPASQKRQRTTMAAAGGLVDTDDFAQINKDMIAYDEKRERVIKDSRDTQKLSKQAIYCLHRGDFDGASDKLEKAQKAAEKLKDIVEAEPSLRMGGSYSNSLEEWAEGRIFQVFLQEGRVPRLDELPLVNRDEFLGGVLDFTGELNRYAVARATARDIPAVQRCRDVVDTLMGVFLEFDFRNGALRKKFDALKYTLKKMETTLYEQSLTENLGFSRAADAGDEEPPADKAPADDAS